jgi:hypothetical protein
MTTIPETKQATTKDDGLQALREVGSEEKTQYWDRQDIMEALREANLRGVRVDSLYARPSQATSRIQLPSRRAS